MMTVIQILDTNSVGHSVRLSTGHTVVIPHSGHEVTIGTQVENIRLGPEGVLVDIVQPAPKPLAPTLEQLNSEAQVAANIASGPPPKAKDASSK